MKKQFRIANPTAPGFTRLKRGKSFTYRDENGNVVKDKEHLERIKSLVIPPAWTGVWICKKASGHIQAIGLDQKGRKQYIYHKNWRAHRDDEKFKSLVDFSKKLPEVRRALDKHLREKKLSRNKVLAACVLILDRKQLRVGNDTYAKQNKTFGLSTVRKNHVRFMPGGIFMSYKGKKGIRRETTIADKKIVRIIEECYKLPGRDLFKYETDGALVDVKSDDINSYIRELTKIEETSAKTFRTWWGCVHMLEHLARVEDCETKTAAKRAIVDAYKKTAKRLNNTVAVCKKSYVAPHIPAAFENSYMWKMILRKRQRAGMSREECQVQHLLERYYE